MHARRDNEIHIRDRAFGQEASAPRWWLGGDPIATAMYNAGSATIPLGERWFIESVRRYRDRAPDWLRPQIAAFVAQEAVHSREHVAFNQQLTAQGYDISRMEARLKRRLALARKLPGAVQLAGTAALEHFTAIFAHVLLSDPRHLEGADPAVARFWRWHALEEIEHKSVAYDTYLAAMEKIGPVARWLLRSGVMLTATVLFADELGRNVAEIFRRDGINTFRSWRRGMAFLLVKPGMMRCVLAHYLAYYRPGFHPWKLDDRELATRAAAELAA